MSRIILLAVDGSEHSKRAQDFYLANVAKDGDQVLLVHVFSPPHPPSLSLRHPSQVKWDEWRSKVNEEQQKIKSILQPFEEKLDDQGIQRKSIVQTGSPGEGIVSTAEENKASLIIIGSRGLNAFRRTFTGSVSDYVVHHINIPVLVIPPN